MAKIHLALFDISSLEQLACGQSGIHRLDPRAKLITTLAFIAFVVSFDRYAVSSLLPLFLFPAAMIALADLPAAYLGKKLLLVAPFAVVIGMFNPLFDQTVLFHLGTYPITGGWVSFASILLRFALSLGAALVLVSTTAFSDLCCALEKLGTPRVFTVQLLFLYRYIFVLMDEAQRLMKARALRSFKKRGMGVRPFANIVGQLLLRTLDRAQRIHMAMFSRGFTGDIRIARPLHMGPKEFVYILGWCSLFLLIRLVNVPEAIGTMITEMVR